MENYVVPKWVQFVDKLPTTKNGKTDKRALELRAHVKVTAHNDFG
jgi:acyl-coenzyme A synthetase/AMP-(fatty) acid ligase